MSQARWSDKHNEKSNQLPGPDHLGWWAALAMVLSLLLHVLAYFALDDMKFVLGFRAPEEVTTAPVRIRQAVTTNQEPPAMRELPDQDALSEPSDSATLLEEVDLIELLPEDQEIDISTTVLEPEYALKVSSPLASGELDAPEVEIGEKIDLSNDLPELGRIEDTLEPAAEGQVIIDPGSVNIDDDELSRFSEDLIKRGNQGIADIGRLDGIETLDRMLDLPSDLLLSKKTMLSSDLIFKFNSDQLKEGARIGLMKLALLIDKNPNLYCWIEGHTDLIGTEEANDKLSLRRAESVKKYLVHSLRIDPERIITRGLGESAPLISTGDQNAQEPNRRVEIKLRKKAPPAVQVKAQKALPKPPKAILVKPARAVIVEPEEAPKRAIPVEPIIPRAIPVEPYE